MGTFLGGGWCLGVEQPAPHPVVSQGDQNFCRFGSKRSTSLFPPYIDANSLRPRESGQSQVGVGVAKGTLAWARGSARSKYPATACTGDVCWGRNKSICWSGRSKSLPTARPVVPAGCSLPSWVFSPPRICFSSVPAGSSISTSLHSLWWSSVTCWGCGPVWRLHLCWLQGTAVQRGAFSKHRKQSHHFSSSSSAPLRNTPCPGNTLVPCRQAARQCGAPRFPTYRAGISPPMES